MEMFRAKDVDPVLAPLGEAGALTTPALGEKDVQLEPTGAVADFGLLPFIRFGETLLFESFDVKLGDITLVFGFA